jgi:hypothetical protein
MKLDSFRKIADLGEEEFLFTHNKKAPVVAQRYILPMAA